jgi:hypothetical protein
MSKKAKDSIIKKLKGDKTFNPFNGKFDYQIVHKEISKALENENSPEKIDLLTGLSTIVFNSYYVDYYNCVRSIINSIGSIGINPEQLTQYFISIANYNYYQLLKNIQGKMSNQETANFSDSLKFKVKPNIFEPTDAIASLETSVDLLNVIFNYIKYFKDIPIDSFKVKEEEEVTKNVSKIWILSNVYYVIKESYDSAIWEDGYISIDNDNKSVFIKYKNEEYPIILRIGAFRLQQTSSLFALSTKNFAERDNRVQELLIKSFREFRNPKIIKFVELENGIIRYKLAKKEDKNSFINELPFYSSITAYYPFLENVNLPKLTKLSLNKLLVLFSELQDLVNKSFEVKIENDKINGVSELKKFSYGIKPNELKSYLASKTKFSNKQINEFIKLLEYSDGRYDFWKKPFIKQQNCYFFPLIAIRSPNILYLIDEWIEEGGFSLDERGRLFENYIKNTLTKELNEKKFPFKIPQRKKFSDRSGNEEEIDIILITKKSVLIAEIKCIKYPMNSRSRHYAINRLRHGAEQVNRKTSYLLANQKIFEEDIGDIENKEIVKAVITNYPILSGLKLDGVPIIDFFILDAYVNTGKLVLGAKISSDCEEFSLTKDGKIIKFYTNEDEFSANLRHYLENPPAVRTLFPLFEIKDYKISLENAAFQIYAQMADTVESISLS